MGNTGKVNKRLAEAYHIFYTTLWLRLMFDSGIVNEGGIKEIIRESEEIRNILGRSVKTARKNR